MLIYRAPAKATLLLAVGGRVENGLHAVAGVFQSVDFADEIGIEPAEGFPCEVVDEAEGLPADVPADDTNLVVGAARAFAALHLDPSQGVAVRIRKRIPTGAGLGGGSTDAGATLLALNDATGGAVSRKALERLAVPLGSDVPFCVRGGTCAVEGTGDRLTSLPPGPPLWWVVGLTGFHCSTGDVYRRFDEMAPGGSALDPTGDPHALADALARGDFDDVAARLRNDLEPAAMSVAPELARGREALEAAGARGVVLAGSGSSWLGLAASREEAEEVAGRAAPGFRRVVVARSLEHGPIEAPPAP